MSLRRVVCGSLPCLSRGDEDPLSTEMRLLYACERWAFNRLLEGHSREELKQEGQQAFGLNSRYCDDAILKAKSVLESQKELLALEIEETGTKLARAQKQRTLTKRLKPMTRQKYSEPNAEPGSKSFSPNWPSSRLTETAAPYRQ